MAKTIVIDLDGVIADFENCKEGCDYSGYPETYQQLKRLNCPLREGAIEFLTKIKSQGFKIIIYTSRVQQESKLTLDWLKKYKIPYDELYLDKPRGIIYIDDLAHEFKSFEEAEKCLKNRSSPQK